MTGSGRLGFSAEKMALWTAANFRGILFFFGLLFFAGLIGVGWTEWREKRESRAYSALYTAQSALQKAGGKASGKGYRGRGREQMLSQILGKGQKAPVYSEEMAKRAAAYGKLLKSLKSSRAAAAFAIDLADFYRFHKKTAAARETISPFALPEKSSALYHLASFQLASYYMEEKNCGKALSLLEALAGNKKAAPFHREAYLQIGLCREGQNQDEEAAASYRKALAGGKEDGAALLAKEYLRLLKLKPVFSGGEKQQPGGGPPQKPKPAAGQRETAPP